jgi:hypothetical protein
MDAVACRQAEPTGTMMTQILARFVAQMDKHVVEVAAQVLQIASSTGIDQQFIRTNKNQRDTVPVRHY